MSWIDGWRSRLRAWVRPDLAAREMEEEFRFHLEHEEAKNRAAGMSGADARRRARISFGAADRYREEARDVWTGRAGRLGADVRYGTRRIMRQPGFALVAALTLGLGVGANTAIFSLVQSVLLRPLPYADPDRLVVFWNQTADLADDTWMSLREVVEYRRATTVFSDIAAYTDLYVNVAEGEPERLLAASVTGNLFETLGTPALAGRTFGPAESAPGADMTVVLGYGLWQRQFGGDPGIVGRKIRISGRPVTVLGVMPPDFRLPLDYREPRPTEIFLPEAIDTSSELPWGSRSYFIIARMAPDASPAAVRADLERTHADWGRAGYVDETDGLRSRVALPMGDLLFRNVRHALWLLFGAVGLLLLVACTNVAHLLLARGDARRRELATQAVLGASRTRLLTQLLVESSVLAVAGGAVGAGFAWVVLAAAAAWAPVNAIRTAGVQLDAGVLTFTAAVALAATMAAGVIPALTLSRTRIGDALASARGAAPAVRTGPRRLFVTAETGVSLVLVLCAALLAQSYMHMRRVNLGFSTDRIVALRVDLPPAEYGDAGHANRFFREVLDRFGAIPGVEAAGAVRILPLSGTIGDWSITVEHRTISGDNPNADWQVVTPGYFETLGIKLREGRSILASDDEDAPLVAVVSETMAERYWPDGDALGARFHLGTLDQPWIQIVGIARSIRHNAVIESPRAEMYIPHAQWPRATGGGSPRYGMTLVARTAGSPADFLPRLREAVQALDPRLPVSDARTLDAIAADALAEPRFTTILFGAFAALALILAAIGLYGVVSFITTRRTREIGVRMALGARPGAVCLLVVGDSIALAAAGVGVGLVASFWATRLLAGQLYDVSPLDPATFIVAPVALLVVATVAAALPAWQAVRTNPVAALRLE